MDEIQENLSAESKPENCSCFTACFGSSKMVKATTSSSINKKTNRRVSFLTFRANTKTAAADATVSKKHNRNIQQIQTPVKKNNLLTGSWMTATTPGQTNIKEKNYEIEEDKFGDLDKQTPFEKKRNSTSGSPPVEKNATRPTKVLQHSVSLPVLPHPKKEKAVRGGGIYTDNIETKNKVDPIVGMSIILVILVIMLIWGKLCAIICTFAWFFMVKAVMDKGENVLNSGGLDLESEEYKKKVVLDGLLHRKHRN